MIEGQMVNLHVAFSRLINKRTHEVTNNMQKNFGFALEGLDLWMLEP